MRYQSRLHQVIKTFFIIGVLVCQILAFPYFVGKVHSISYEWYYKPTSYSQLVSWYLDLESAYPGYLHVFKANEVYGLGQTTGGYDLYYVRITNESNGLHKPEVFLSGGPHGNEKTGTTGLYWFTDWLMRYALHVDFSNPDREWLQWLLNNREIYLCVCHNPWGFDNSVRYDANGWDLNREADHGGPGSPTGGLWASVNGKTLRGFANDHALRIGVWFHDGARMILYPWKNQHSSVSGTSPISGRTYQRVGPDFYFYDASCLRLGDYIGDYGGDLDSGNIGNSYTMGMGGPGVIPHWAYGADVFQNPAEDSYVADETFGNYPGAGMLGLDPEVYGSGDPPESMFGNDTINRFGAEIRRYALYVTDLAQPYLLWRSGTPGNNTSVDQGTLTFKWQVRGCLVVDSTFIQWGRNPDPIDNPEYTTSDHNEHAGDYLGGTGWDNAESGSIAGVTYSEPITLDEAGDYYFVAKAKVDQIYADVLAPGEYGDEPYLRLVKERTNSTYYEELSGADGLEQINGQLWWYSPVVHIQVSENSAMQDWWNNDWPYRKKITINHTKVDEELSGFPVLVNVTDTDLSTKAQSDGDDIVFADEENVKLNHEIEFYNSSNGQLAAWVSVPDLSPTEDKVLYMYYGNATVSSQENVAGVWDSNFMMVQHLSETSGTHYDSTANDNDGTVSGAVQGVSGKIDGADDFDGTNDAVSVLHSNTLTSFASAFTASAWVKLDDVATQQGIINKYDTAGDQRSWYLDFRGHTSPKAFGMSGSSDGVAIQTWTAQYAASAGTWYHVALVWQSSQVPKFYVNGQQITTTGSNTIASIYNNTATPLYIGRAWGLASPERFFDGMIDEARVSNVARSAGWIATCYSNQHDPSSFYTIGSEETPPEAPVIYNPNPLDGATGISKTLAQLSFKLTDFQGDLINYTATTSPNIGIGSGTNVPNGTYTVPVSGLAYETLYAWQIIATDGTHSSNRTFTFTTETAPVSWWDNSWPYRKRIALDHTEVSASLTGFPVLIDTTDSDLASKAQSDGDDIVFTTETGTKLNHEIEFYNASIGHLIVWVRVPSLSSSVDTVLYMYYGNAGASSQENVAGVWDSNFMMVQHLSETSGTHYDSTANDNDGTVSGAVQGVSGKIDGADDFDGTNDEVSIPHSNTLTGFTGAMTVSVWVRLDDVNSRQTMLNKYNTTNNQRGWALDYTINQPSAGQNACGLIVSSNGVTYESFFAPYTASAGQWVHVAAVWTPNQTSIPFYINGVQISGNGTQGVTVPSIFNNTLESLYFGRSYPTTPERYLDGTIDEVQLSNVARSSGWLATSYNNQRDPSSFYSIGNEETPAVTTIKIEPETTYAILDSDEVVHVMITDVTDLYGWEFQLDYNASILDLTSTSIVVGGLNEPTHVYYNLTDEPNGHLWFAASTIHPTTTGASYLAHAIIELHFHTLEVGTSYLDLYGTHLSDSQINPITHNIANGSMIVGDHGEIDLTVVSIEVLDHGCSIYANDTHANGTKYFYPVEVAILNTGTADTDAFYVELEVYWVNGTFIESLSEIIVPSLAAGVSEIVNFTDVFSPTHTGLYRLTATVDSRDDIAETYEDNNILIEDGISVTVMGDINGNQVVNILDAVIMALAWNADEESTHWNIRADINHDGHIDVLDGVRIGLNWGKTA
jgi:hypothetical protein